MQKVKVFLSAAVLISIHQIACAQLLAYNNKEQILGAAAISPESGGKLLEKLVLRCSQYGDTTRLAGETAMNAWKQRHQNYLDENKIVQQEIMAFVERATVPDAQKKDLRDTFETGTKNIIDAQFKAMEAPISAMPQVQQKVSICMSYFDSVNAGKLDLKNNDPVVTKFLDERINTRKKKLNDQSPQ